VKKKENTKAATKVRGRPRSGVTAYVRDLLRAAPDAATPELRRAALEAFGYTPDIDRHFPQLVWRAKQQIKKESAK
jgi:hypothetical protein